MTSDRSGPPAARLAAPPVTAEARLVERGYADAQFTGGLPAKYQQWGITCDRCEPHPRASLRSHSQVGAQHTRLSVRDSAWWVVSATAATQA